MGVPEEVIGDALPPVIEVRKVDFEDEHEVVGDEYVVIDGGSFEIVPVVGSRPSIAGPLEVVEWKVRVTTDQRSNNDPYAEPDVEELDASNFHHAINIVTGLWVADQMAGHAEAMGEAAEIAALAGIRYKGA